jgi:hypothetical protein
MALQMCRTFMTQMTQLAELSGGGEGGGGLSDAQLDGLVETHCAHVVQSVAQLGGGAC